jgi:hypothetical protein
MAFKESRNLENIPDGDLYIDSIQMLVGSWYSLTAQISISLSLQNLLKLIDVQ